MKLSLVLLWAVLFSSSSSTPILIDDLDPLVVAVHVEDERRISGDNVGANSEAVDLSKPEAFTSLATNMTDHIEMTKKETKDVEETSNFNNSNFENKSSSLISSNLMRSSGLSIDDILNPDVSLISVEDRLQGVHKNLKEEEIEEEKDESTSLVDKPTSVVDEATSVVPAIRIPMRADSDSIPADFYEQIDSLKSVEEFIKATNIRVEIEPIPFQVDGSLASFPGLGCQPKKKCVSVRPRNRHPSEDVFPSSIDVERCGGCCNHPELECLPWSTEPHTVRLLKYGYNEDGSLTNLGFIDQTVIRELKCKCVKVQT